MVFVSSLTAFFPAPSSAPGKCSHKYSSFVPEGFSLPSAENCSSVRAIIALFEAKNGYVNARDLDGLSTAETDRPFGSGAAIGCNRGFSPSVCAFVLKISRAQFRQDENLYFVNLIGNFLPICNSSTSILSSWMAVWRETLLPEAASPLLAPVRERMLPRGMSAYPWMSGTNQTILLAMKLWCKSPSFTVYTQRLGRLGATNATVRVLWRRRVEESNCVTYCAETSLAVGNQ